MGPEYSELYVSKLQQKGSEFPFGLFWHLEVEVIGRIFIAYSGHFGSIFINI